MAGRGGVAVPGVVGLVEEGRGDVGEVRHERVAKACQEALGFERRDVVLACQHGVDPAAGNEPGQVGAATVDHELDAGAAGSS